MKKYWRSLVIIILGLMSCHRQSIPGPELENSHYFEETGQTVRGEFLHFFDKYGGVESLGYPISEEITVDGWRVQYFQKGRLEYHPENEPTYRITVGWLGDLLQRRHPPISVARIPPENTTQHRYFPQTGHTVSGDFLDYFDAQGGSVRFGQPISEPFLLNGRLTQDFQSARFFWTPENDVSVTLEEIGRVHFEAIGLSKTSRVSEP